MTIKNHTLAIIKPHAVKKKHIGAIINKIEQAGFQIKALRYTHMNLPVAKAFYQIHRQRPFYNELCQGMTESSIVAICLHKENIISHFRKFIGATDPSQAQPGTIRNQFGEDIGHNAIHASDSEHAASLEIPMFFTRSEWQISPTS